LQYYADENGRVSLRNETERKLADSHYPATKKWVYLFHVSIVDENRAGALAREWLDGNTGHVLRELIAEQFTKC
jgi:hypothetical protein